MNIKVAAFTVSEKSINTKVALIRLIAVHMPLNVAKFRFFRQCTATSIVCYQNNILNKSENATSELLVIYIQNDASQ